MCDMVTTIVSAESIANDAAMRWLNWLRNTYDVLQFEMVQLGSGLCIKAEVGGAQFINEASTFHLNGHKVYRGDVASLPRAK